MGRLGIGESKGKEARTTSFSTRAKEHKLTVERKRCPSCGHHKALSTLTSVYKCSKCGYDHKKIGGKRGN